MSLDEIIEKIDEIIDETIKKIQELDDINESLILFKNFWEESENDEKKKKALPIIAAFDIILIHDNQEKSEETDLWRKQTAWPGPDAWAKCRRESCCCQWQCL